MKLKLDENLGRRQAELFRAAGHDAVTVVEQNLSSASDHEVIGVCQGEERCLVTLDLDFSNPLVFRPWEYSGIAVLRVRRPASVVDLDVCAATLIAALRGDDIRGQLWIVEVDRIRVYRPERES